MTGVKKPARIFFVCLGNICRSPMAQGATAMLAAEQGICVDLDSAGTGDWHVGRPPDPRAQATAQAYGCDISHLRARQVTGKDFERFDHIVVMDTDNLADLNAMRPDGAKAELSLLLDYAGTEENRSVADPYYGEDDGFQTVWNDIVCGARGLLASVMMRDRKWNGSITHNSCHSVIDLVR